MAITPPTAAPSSSVATTTFAFPTSNSVTLARPAGTEVGDLMVADVHIGGSALTKIEQGAPGGGGWTLVAAVGDTTAGWAGVGEGTQHRTGVWVRFCVAVDEATPVLLDASGSPDFLRNQRGVVGISIYKGARGYVPTITDFYTDLVASHTVVSVSPAEDGCFLHRAATISDIAKNPITFPVAYTKLYDVETSGTGNASKVGAAARRDAPSAGDSTGTELISWAGGSASGFAGLLILPAPDVGGGEVGSELDPSVTAVPYFWNADDEVWESAVQEWFVSDNVETMRAFTATYIALTDSEGVLRWYPGGELVSPPPVPDPLSAPTITGVTTANQALIVTFTPPDETGGAPITKYTVDALSAVGLVVATQEGATSPITVSGLANGTAYRARVRAHTVLVPGGGPNSADSGLYTPQATSGTSAGAAGMRAAAGVFPNTLARLQSIEASLVAAGAPAGRKLGHVMVTLASYYNARMFDQARTEAHGYFNATTGTWRTRKDLEFQATFHMLSEPKGGSLTDAQRITLADDVIDGFYDDDIKAVFRESLGYKMAYRLSSEYELIRGTPAAALGMRAGQWGELFDKFVELGNAVAAETPSVAGTQFRYIFNGDGGHLTPVHTYAGSTYPGAYPASDTRKVWEVAAYYTVNSVKQVIKCDYQGTNPYLNGKDEDTYYTMFDECQRISKQLSTESGRIIGVVFPEVGTWWRKSKNQATGRGWKGVTYAANGTTQTDVVVAAPTSTAAVYPNPIDVNRIYNTVMDKMESYPPDGQPGGIHSWTWFEGVFAWSMLQNEPEMWDHTWKRRVGPCTYTPWVIGDRVVNLNNVDTWDHDNSEARPSVPQTARVNIGPRPDIGD